MKLFFSNVLVAVITASCMFFLFKSYYPPGEKTEYKAAVQLVNDTPDEHLNIRPREWASSELPIDFREVSRRATAAVVNIGALSATGYTISTGSGVIISADGYIVTNRHVIEDGSTFEVTLYNKRKLTAELVGADQQTDLALLKVAAKRLIPLAISNSDLVEVGEWVLAVGNPFNLSSTVTAGIVSAKARNIDILNDNYAIESFIQTDAVVNPGNSGGALVNTHGELIGINTAIITESGVSEGYSFAIPSNLVRKITADLREFGTVKRAILGVKIQEVTDVIALELSLPQVVGVYVKEVAYGGSAYHSGIKQGDVIISINGNITNSVPELQEQVARYRPGDQVSLEYIRQGRKFRRDGIELKALQEEEYYKRR